MKLDLWDNRACFSFGGVLLSLSSSGDLGWRLQSGRNGVFDDFGAGQTLARDLGEEPRIVREPITAEEAGKGWRLSEAGGTSVSLSDEGIVFFDENGCEKACLTGLSDDGSSSSVTGILYDGERCFGTGERFNTLNQRGKKVEIMAIDKWCQTEGNSYVPIPMFLSSRCAGVFMNRYEHSVFDLGAEFPDRWAIEQQDAPLDLYVFLGTKPQELLYAYSRITGFAPVPSDWLYGTQVCRYYPDFSTAAGVMEMAARMEENGFPWEAVILEGWPAYDAARFDELHALADKLHGMGKKVMVYEACGRVPPKGEEAFGMKDSYSPRNGETGERTLPDTDTYNPADHPTRQSSRYVDITSEEAMAWWHGPVWGKLVGEFGIDGAKIDFCEQFPDHIPVQFADGRPAHGAHHGYPTLYNAKMYRFFNTRPEGGMCLSRGGGIGAQRYPFLWAGDQLREYFYLKAILRAVLSSGLSGIPFMSYDMSAYRPARNSEENPEAEVFIRGLEYTAFSANIQTHGVVTRPYDFDPHTKDVYRAYARLHDALRPYLVEQGKIASEQAVPLMRHLWLYDCTDERAADTEDEYMLGDGLLVAPVLDPVSVRDVYLPAGQWEDLFTGERYSGRCTLKDVPAPPEAIPVYRRIGSDSAVLEEVLAAARPLLDEIRKLSGSAKERYHAGNRLSNK